MVIDSHTHIFPDDVAAVAIPNLLTASQGTLNAHTDATLCGLKRSMQESGVDRSIALPLATTVKQGKEIIDWIEEVRKENPEVYFFASVHPKDENYKSIIEKASSIGVKGIKFHPQHQDFAVDDEAFYPIVEEAVQKGMIMHFHSGYESGFPDSDLASIPRFVRLLGRFPKAKLILGHTGGYKEWSEAYKLLKGKEVYYDCAFALEPLIHGECKYLEAVFREREDFFLFGTDSPWKSQKEDLKIIEETDFFTAEQKEKLLSENALKLLGESV